MTEDETKPAKSERKTLTKSNLLVERQSKIRNDEGETWKNLVKIKTPTKEQTYKLKIKCQAII
ncbi:24985_t:CDS:1, partial [Dentiscutata erythropus]